MMESIGIILNSEDALTVIISAKNNRLNRRGDSAVLLVRANRRWNRTGLYIKKGEEYKFTALPGERWIDAGIQSTAEGYRLAGLEWLMSIAKRLKHLPEAKWMALAGAIGENNATAFLIGESVSHLMQSDGELTCFANDAEGFFWNNLGHIWVSVMRVN